MAAIPHPKLPRHRQSRGFTLLELLVVVFIIGILATMFTLSLGVLGSDPELEKEVDRLQSLLILARENALTNGREFGIHFYPDGYEFATFREDFVEYYDPDDEEQDQSTWTVMPSGDMLGPRQLPEGILIELEIDGRQIVLDEKDDEGQEEDERAESLDPDSDITEPYRPQIWLFSTGDMNPFVIRFRREFSNEGLMLEFKDDGTAELSES